MFGGSSSLFNNEPINLFKVFSETNERYIWHCPCVNVWRRLTNGILQDSVTSFQNELRVKYRKHYALRDRLQNLLLILSKFKQIN